MACRCDTFKVSGGIHGRIVGEGPALIFGFPNVQIGERARVGEFGGVTPVVLQVIWTRIFLAFFMEETRYLMI